jgi:hypothetical protein
MDHRPYLFDRAKMSVGIVETDCDCPICPLIAYNIQVCNLKIIFPINEIWGTFGVPPADIVKDDALPDEIKAAVAKLVQHIRQRTKPKVGKSTIISFLSESTKKRCSIDLLRKSVRVYDACIHVENNGPQSNAPDGDPC